MSRLRRVVPVHLLQARWLSRSGVDEQGWPSGAVQRDAQSKLRHPSRKRHRSDVFGVFQVTFTDIRSRFSNINKLYIIIYIYIDAFVRPFSSWPREIDLNFHDCAPISVFRSSRGSHTPQRAFESRLSLSACSAAVRVDWGALALIGPSAVAAGGTRLELESDSTDTDPRARPCPCLLWCPSIQASLPPSVGHVFPFCGRFVRSPVSPAAGRRSAGPEPDARTSSSPAPRRRRTHGRERSDERTHSK